MPRIPAPETHWLPVMVEPIFASQDELGHQCPRYCAILKLIPARPDRHIETGNTGFVIDRYPVVRNVVAVHHPADRSGDSQVWYALRHAHDLVAHLLAEIFGIFIRVDPMSRIASRVLRADENLVAGFRSRVAPDIAVGSNETACFIIGRR